MRISWSNPRARGRTLPGEAGGAALPLFLDCGGSGFGGEGARRQFERQSAGAFEMAPDGAFGGAPDSEHELTFNAGSTPPLATGSWVALEVPLTAFTGLVTRAHVAQLIISGDTPTVYVDGRMMVDRRRLLVLEDPGLQDAARAYGEPARILAQNPFIW